MSYTEKQIVHENGDYFVLEDKTAYFVMVSGSTHAISDSAYRLDTDGLSVAKARADYLARREGAYSSFRGRHNSQASKNRNAARETGATTYEGAVCKRHPSHGGTKYTSNARCVGCAKLDKKKQAEKAKQARRKTNY